MLYCGPKKQASFSKPRCTQRGNTLLAKIWRLVLYLYGGGFTLLLPVIFLRLWLRSLRLPAYRHRWLERLGQVPLPPLEKGIWFHAVSVGEALSMVPLVRRFHMLSPEAPILITTTTPTGSERVQMAFKDELGKRIYHCYFPYDIPWVWSRFFQRVKPALLVLMETELWPQLLAQCASRGIPICIANARLSLRSVQRYQWLGQCLPQMLQTLDVLAVQSALDAKRYAQLGVPQVKIVETGNIKFDLPLPCYLQEAGGELRKELGSERRIWIASSTHEGEEAIVLRVHKKLRSLFDDLLLILVPRHPDRFNKVAQLCTQEGFQIARRSKKQTCHANMEVYLGDTMGELLLLYAASDVAFVGGSFAKVGGHNLLEPAALGLPVLTGPQLFNFIAISHMLVEAKGARVVENEVMLEHTLAQLFTDPREREAQGRYAKAVVTQNKGALEKVLQLILRYFPSEG